MAIGELTFVNERGETVTTMGVNAHALIGDILIGSELHIYYNDSELGEKTDIVEKFTKLDADIDGVNIEVGKKVGADEIISAINISPEDIKIMASKIALEGLTTIKPDGKHGDIMNLKFIDSLHPFTEMAIGGGNPLAHPDLVPFLRKLKEKKIIASMTVNQTHFMQNIELLKQLCDERLIYGLGVSFRGLDDGTLAFLEAIEQFPNAVIHVINGVVSPFAFATLANRDLKILILGYKDFRRGVNNREKQGAEIARRQAYVYDALPFCVQEKWFKTISFDNLAIEQLNVKRLMSADQWEEFFMGGDGRFTMYVDAVNEQFAVSSVSETRHELLDNIDDMFTVVKQDADRACHASP